MPSTSRGAIMSGEGRGERPAAQTAVLASVIGGLVLLALRLLLPRSSAT